MAELVDDVLDLFAPWPTANALAGQLGFESANAARTAAQLSLPLVVSGMVEQLQDPLTSRGLLATIQTIDVGQLHDLEVAYDQGLYEPAGSAAIHQSLGPARQQLAASLVAEEVGCDERSAFELLPPVGWTVLASVVARRGSEHNRHTLLTILQKERDDLRRTGWGDWMDAADSVQETAATTISASHMVGSEAEAEAYDPHYPPPLSRSARPHNDPGRRPRQSNPAHRPRSAAVQGPSHTAAVRTATQDRSQGLATPDPRRARKSRSSVPLILLGLLVLAAASAAAIWYLLDQRNDSETSAEGAAPIADQVTDTTVGNVEGSTIVPIDVLLSGSEGAAEATGYVELRFNQGGEEVCYNVTTTDFPSLASMAITEDGAEQPVLDIDSLHQSSIGCASIAEADVQAILSNPEAFAVAVGDGVGSAQLVGTLSESPGDRVTPEAEESTYDPDGGGAFVRIVGGQLSFEGPVPDAETADALMATFADIDLGPGGAENLLEIVAGAPKPSGRILVEDDVLFEIGSATLAAGNDGLAGLAKFFVARPDWTITVIGHTDNTGIRAQNLELSKLRAAAVREELIALGVNPDSIVADGVGDANPEFSNGTPEGRAMNRRIEFLVDAGTGS